MDPLRLSEKIPDSSMFHKSSIMLASRRQCMFKELGMMTLSVHTVVLWIVVFRLFPCFTFFTFAS